MRNRDVIKALCKISQEIDIVKHTTFQIRDAIGRKIELNSNERALLLALPTHLIKTLLTAERIGGCTAQEVSDITLRARAVESSYLCQLVNLGFLRKSRRKRYVVFEVSTRNALHPSQQTENIRNAESQRFGNQGK